MNNQEHNRFNLSSEVGERAMEEIYLPPFQAAVQEANVWSVMACYNRVNGIFGCDHRELLRERLIDEWGFQGFVISDWFATKYADTIKSMKAGLSLEMPFPIIYRKRKIKKALSTGEISEGIFHDNLKRLLRTMFLTGLFDNPENLPKGSRNTAEHQDAARKIAEEGVVLLKNDNILPLNIDKIKKIAILGPNADEKMAFGGGSSAVRAKYEITPKQGLENKCKEKITITKKPKDADVALLFMGLNHNKHNDRENKDRFTLRLPHDQIELISETVQANPNTVVILINGSPIAMDEWIQDVSAIIEAWYPGCEGGNVIADILFGDINPSGKLTMTFPKRLGDSPAHAHPWTYPGINNVYQDGTIELDKDDFRVYYEEGIYVGYRYFDTFGVDPLFPFGFGLSYTQFSFTNLKLNTDRIKKEEDFIVSVEIKNTGKMSGAEVIQVYITDIESSLERPEKELCGFKKVFLEPNEQETVNITIKNKSLAFYDDKEHTWKIEKGKFKILIGSSSRDIHLQKEIEYLG
jgi:beta-glucosidase